MLRYPAAASIALRISLTTATSVLLVLFASNRRARCRATFLNQKAHRRIRKCP